MAGMTVGTRSAVLRIIVLIAMVLGSLSAPVGLSRSHAPIFAMTASADDDLAFLDHGHSHDDADDDHGAGHGHGHHHNPADHSHVTAGLVGDYAIAVPRFAREWPEHAPVLAKRDRPFPLERPPRGLIAA